MIYILFFSFIICILVNTSYTLDKGQNSSIYLPSKTKPFDYSKITDLVVFGDSYSQTFINENTLKFTGENQSGGKTWPLHLIDFHDMYLWNFAVDGSTFTFSYNVVNDRSSSSLEIQFQLFNSKMSNWKGDSTLFVIWFGINDIIVSNAGGQDTINTGLTVAFDTVLDLYKRGGRNFLFINVPPFNISPWGAVFNEPSISDFIYNFNVGYQNMVSQLPSDFPDANIFLYNAMDEFKYLFENYKSEGIKYINEMASDDPNGDDIGVIEQYFWYNLLHPSTSVHRCLAIDIHQFLNKSSVNKVQLSTTHEKALANFDRDNSFFPVEYMTTPTAYTLEQGEAQNNDLNKNNTKSSSESGSTLKYHNTFNSSYFALTIFLFYFLFF